MTANEKVRLGNDETSWELIYKRNKVERLKNEKFPYDVKEELPELIEKGYEKIPEDDIVRLYWYGIAHDKPKVGSFMVRLKVPCGIITPAQLRGVGKISEEYGDNYTELTTRMGIQLHEVELGQLPDVMEAIEDTGFTTKGAEGDTVRNVTGCPLTGISPHETFNVRPVIEDVHEYFTGNPDYSDLPRKLKFTITACPLQCSGPEFHGISLLGVIHEGTRGFAVTTGGGLSSTPRMARDLGMFVPEDEALDVLKGLTDIWNETLTYRVSRPKSRIKFMVDDHGPEKIRNVLEQRLDRSFEGLEAPEPVAGDQSHIGVQPQKQDGLYSLGYSVPQGWVKGHQLRGLADVLEDVDGEARFTRDQNFILVDIPEDKVQRVKDKVAEIGFSLDDDNKIFGHSVACTSHDYCNYSVAKTKRKAQEILDTLVEQYGSDIEEGLTIKMDGCPHACAQHWMGNIGLQGTTSRTESGDKIEAYDITLRGGLGTDASIGEPIVRRLPSEETTEAVSRLVGAWLEERRRRDLADPSDFRFPDFCKERSDRKLKSIALDRDVENIEDNDVHVTLELRGPLLEYTGGVNEFEFRTTRAGTVGKLLEVILRRYGALESELFDRDGDVAEHVNLYVNEQDIRERDGLDTTLAAGDEVMAMPALAGG